MKWEQRVCMDRGKESDSAQGGWMLAKRSAWKVIVKIIANNIFSLSTFFSLTTHSRVIFCNGIELVRETPHNFIHFIFIVNE
jgi:hypothetical protein